MFREGSCSLMLPEVPPGGWTSIINLEVDTYVTLVALLHTFVLEMLSLEV